MIGVAESRIRGTRGGRGALLLGAALAWTIAGCSESVTGLGEEFTVAATAQLLDEVSGASLGSLIGGHTQKIGGVLADDPVASVMPPFDISRRPRLDGRSAHTRTLGRAVLQSRASGRESLGLLPFELLGKTLVLESLSGYVVDPEQTDAPEDGVRFTLYEVNEVTGLPQLIPPRTAGHADVMEEAPTGVAEIHLKADGDGSTIADYRLSGSSTETIDTFESDFFSSGYVYGQDRVDFLVEEEFFFGPGFESVDVLFVRELTVPEHGLSARLSVEGTVTTDPVNPGEVQVTLTLGDGVHSVVMDFTDNSFEVDGVVMYDEQLVLLISGDPVYPTFRLPDGELPTDEDRTILEDFWFAANDLLFYGEELLGELAPLLY